MSRDEVEGLVHEERRALPALHLVLRRPYPILRRDVGMRLRTFISAHAFVVAIGGELRRIGDIAPTAEMPFSDVRRGVTGGFQLARQRRRLRIEKVHLLALAIACARLHETGDVPTRREISREESAARWRANRRSAVVAGE